MEIPEELARAAHEKRMAAGRNATVDDLTNAITTGASPAEISRLEASAANSRNSGYGAGSGADEREGYGAEPDADGGHEAGETPPNENRNAERIRLTGLEERDKGLVNAANIIARTEGIPFDEAWRRVNGNAAHHSPDSSQAEAGNEGGETGGAEALREHHLHMARELYGDLQDPGSAHWREAHQIATDPSHPDHDPELLDKPHGALVIAKIAAANLGLKGSDSKGREAGRVAKPAAATKQSASQPPARSQAEITRASEQAALDAVEGESAQPARRAQKGYLRL